MKTIKILLIISIFTLLSACTDKSNSLGKFSELTTDNKQDVNINIQPILPAFLGDGDSFDFDVSLPSTFDVESTVRVAVKTGNDFNRVNTSDVVVAQGDTGAIGTISLSDEDGLETGNFEPNDLAVLYVKAFKADDGKGILYVGKSDSVSIPLYDRTPVLDNTGLSILIDWTNPSVNDIDLEVIDAGFTSIFANSGSGTRYEDAILENVNADGDYVVYLTVYTSSTDILTPEDISYKAFFKSPNGDANLIEGIIPAGTTYNQRVGYVGFSKSNTNEYSTFTSL